MLERDFDFEGSNSVTLRVQAVSYDEAVSLVRDFFEDVRADALVIPESRYQSPYGAALDLKYQTQEAVAAVASFGALRGDWKADVPKVLRGIVSELQGALDKLEGSNREGSNTESTSR